MCRADSIRPTALDLLDVVAGELLTEGGMEPFVLGLEHVRCVTARADDQIPLPGDLAGGVCLRPAPGPKANAGDAVAALDGNAAGEGPLVGQRTALALSLAVSSAHRRVLAPQGMVRVDQSLTCGAEALLIQVGKKHSVS